MVVNSVAGVISIMEAYYQHAHPYLSTTSADPLYGDATRLHDTISGKLVMASAATTEKALLQTLLLKLAHIYSAYKLRLSHSSTLAKFAWPSSESTSTHPPTTNSARPLWVSQNPQDRRTQ